MAVDLPITGVCIVADMNKCPPNYTVLDKTYGSIPEDADLWKDKLWGRKITRYLCVERGYSDQNKNVLVDVAIINEREPVPPGFTVVDPTSDTREKAVKKKILCVRWMDKTMTQEAITELVLSGRNTKKPPSTFTLVGELNGLNVCFKIGRLVLPANNQSQLTTNTTNSYQNNTYVNMSNLGPSLPYALNPTTTSKADSIKPTGSEQSSTAPLNALIGVPWQLCPKLQSLSEFKDITIPQICYKSLYDVEKEYQYDFVAENSVKSAK